jgi:RND family efflux transporter MFP subunit
MKKKYKRLLKRYKKQYKKYLTWKNVKIGAVVLVILILIINTNSDKTIQEEIVPEKTVKTVEVIPFSQWSPDDSREVLATVASSGEVDILAEVTGTIAKTYAKIGDEVKKGQLLANFQLANDATQVAYDNAVRSMEATRISVMNSVSSSQISLQTAQQSLAQTRLDEAQNYTEVFEQLKTKARNSETTASNVLDWADRILRASPRFRYSDDVTRSQIGSNDSIKKQDTKNMVELLVFEKEKLPTLPVFQLKDTDFIRYAQRRLDFLEEIQAVVRNLDDLIRRTALSQNFTSTNRATYQIEAETFSASIDAAILTLETQIEAARSENQRNRLSILTAENAVRNAEAALELTQAQADSSTSTAQSSLALARASQSDLQVRAPFSGTIAGENITDYDRVTAGQTLFTIVSGDVEPKLKAAVTRDELKRMQSAPEKISVILPSGIVKAIPNFFVAGKMNGLTQKINVEFPLDSKEELFVGSYVKLLLPIKNGIPNLLPISAVSFEPSGAEVVVIDSENIVRRKQIQTAKIISDSIEISEGLEPGELVVRFRNRVTAGEEVKIMNN